LRGTLVVVLGAACGSPNAEVPTPIYVPPLAPSAAPSTAPLARELDAGAAETPPTELDSTVRAWSEPSQCSDFDYFPEGGMRNFWCHRPARVSLEALRSRAGTAIFASGPHNGDDLKLDSPASFGHYNPEFVDWLVTHAVPSERGTIAQKATQASYDAHVKPLATIFWKTLSKARQDTACFAREQTAYGDLIARKQLPKDYYERWFWFMNPLFCQRGLKGANDQFYYDNGFDAGVDGNVTKTAIGFWLRRSMDGTMDRFAKGLENLVKAYQPELIGATRLPEGAALTKALDAGVKASSSCSDAKTFGTNPRVEITVSPDGKLEATLHRTSGRLPSAKAAGSSTCAAQAFSAQSVPPFDGPPLHFTRTIVLR
jgi:hypothetical protein